MKCIDADKLIKIIEGMQINTGVPGEFLGTDEETFIGKYELIDLIAEMPEVELTGDWELDTSEVHPDIQFYTCPGCGKLSRVKTHYCPDCGQKMRTFD